MKGRRTAEQIVPLVREAEEALAQGKTVEDVCKNLVVSKATLVRWRHKYGGLGTPEAKRLRELEKENATLKHLLAESELEKRILKVALRGKA